MYQVSSRETTNTALAPELLLVRLAARSARRLASTLVGELLDAAWSRAYSVCALAAHAASSSFDIVVAKPTRLVGTLVYFATSSPPGHASSPPETSGHTAAAHAPVHAPAHATLPSPSLPSREEDTSEARVGGGRTASQEAASDRFASDCEDLSEPTAIREGRDGADEEGPTPAQLLRQRLTRRS